MTYMLTEEQVQQIEVELKYARNVCAGNNWSTEGSDEAIAMLNKVKLQEQAEQEPVAFKVHRGEVCYKSDEDDQSYGMWCPVSPDCTASFPEGTNFYAAPVRTKDLMDDVNRLKRIATIAHCGGIANMSVDDALTAIRKITLPYFDREASDEEVRAVIAADRELNK